MSAAAAPALSAILLTPDRFYRLRQTIAALQAQTVCEQIEIVLVAPSLSDLALDEQALGVFHSHQVATMGRKVFSCAEGWAAGVQQARAPVVVLCEDHSFPDPTWAERLLDAHRQPWAAVAPAMRNGNPESLASCADFIMGYGEWALPVSSGIRQHLPGHNCSYKRNFLLGYGAELALQLEAESILHWDLRRQGHQLYLQADAVTSHWNYDTLASWLTVQWWAGRRFAARRAASWSWPRRLAFACGSPLIPLVRFRRIYRQLRTPGHSDGATPILLANIVLGLLVDASGQMIGSLFGLGRAGSASWRYELHRERRLHNQASKERGAQDIVSAAQPQHPAPPRQG